MNIFNDFRIKWGLGIGPLYELLCWGFMFVQLWDFVCVKAIGASIEGQVYGKKVGHELHLGKKKKGFHVFST